MTDFRTLQRGILAADHFLFCSYRQDACATCQATMNDYDEALQVANREGDDQITEARKLLTRWLDTSPGGHAVAVDSEQFLKETL